MTNQRDPLYEQAVYFAQRTESFTRVGLCAQLGIGYNRACRLVDEMEDNGVVQQQITNQGLAFKVATVLPAAILNTMQKEINLSILAGDGCEQFQQKSPPMPD
jgi:hypothetical protein